jgi:hypothetical protein
VGLDLSILARWDDLGMQGRSDHAAAAVLVEDPGPVERSLPAAVPTVGVPSASPLPDDVEGLLRRLRMPHARLLAPEVLATAKA